MKKPNVILIVMDTVRADHLSCYGYHQKTTPNIDKIARDGVLFEKAYSAGIWSPSSHASILTGKYPSYHKTLGKNVCLDKNNTTIAEILRHNEYKTAGITNCQLLWPSSGFEKGFQKFIIPPSTSFQSVKSVANDVGFILSSFVQGPKHFSRALVSGPDKYAYYTNEIIKAFLERNHSSNPFFLFVNYFDCHAPYNPPKPFKEKFLEGFHEPRLYILDFLLEKIFGTTGERFSNSNLEIKKLQYLAGGSCESRFSFMAKELQISKKEWEVICSWYDGEIAYLDQCIGDLINLLHDKNLFENTLIVITADHGENFGEHGLAGHHFCLYDSLLHIPLIMSYPPVLSGKDRMSKIVSSIDILPTIMSICNINVKVDIQGKSLCPLEERVIHEFICAECGESLTDINVHHLKSIFSRFSQKLRSIDMGFKSIRDDSSKYIVSAKGEEQLYNISKDPLEEKNIAYEFPDRTKELRSQMEKIIDTDYFGPKEILGTETERKKIMDRLRALGYA